MDIRDVLRAITRIPFFKFILAISRRIFLAFAPTRIGSRY
jgi:hypothetical protein